MSLKEKLASQPSESLRRKPSHLEDRLQIACVRWFSFQYPDLAAYLHHSPNGGKRSKTEAAIFKAMGTKAGFPDLLFFHPNASHPFIGIEMKTQKGRQSPSQREYQQLFLNIGADYRIVRSLDDFIAVMKEYIREIPDKSNL